MPWGLTRKKSLRNAWRISEEIPGKKIEKCLDAYLEEILEEKHEQSRDQFGIQASISGKIPMGFQEQSLLEVLVKI